MISKVFSRFSTKKSGFFWNDINPNVLEAQYAVRGVVPTLAVQMQNELQSGSKSNIKSLSLRVPLRQNHFLQHW